MHASTSMSWPGAADARFRGDDPYPPSFTGEPTPPRRLAPTESLFARRDEGRASYKQNVEPAAEADDDETPVDERDPEHVWTCAGLAELLRSAVARGELPREVFDQVYSKLCELPSKLAKLKKAGASAQNNGEGRLREPGELVEEGPDGMPIAAAKVAQDIASRRLFMGDPVPQPGGRLSAKAEALVDEMLPAVARLRHI